MGQEVLQQRPNDIYCREGFPPTAPFERTDRYFQSGFVFLGASFSLPAHLVFVLVVTSRSFIN